MSNNNEMSKSKMKREARKAEVSAAKRKQAAGDIFGWVIGLAVAAVIITTIVMGILSTVNKTVSNANYSACLTADGFVEGANLDKVKDLNMETLTVTHSLFEYTDEDVDNEISSILESHAEFVADETHELVSGETVNIDYVGYMDDVAFEGGTATDSELTLGSGKFIDTFEDQLVGHHPGDVVDVNVTFPETYENNPDYAGKPARFVVTINSVRVVPELTDAFVAENFSDTASTVEEYRAALKADGDLDNLKEYLAQYITDNCSVASLPKKYVNQLKCIIKNYDEQTYEYYNNFYMYYYGQQIYSKFSDYTGMSDSEYEKTLAKEAKAQASAELTYEAIFKKANLSVSDETYNKILEGYGEDAEATYGKPYLMSMAVRTEVINYLAGVVTVVE